MKTLSKWIYALLLGCALSVQARQIVQDSDIFWDIHYGDTRAITRWLKSDQDVNQLNDDGQSVLIKSVIKENKVLVKKLLANSDININVIDRFGNTALDYAVQQENKVLVRLLLKKKAQVTTDFNAIKCRELAAKRSGWRVLGAVLLGAIGVSIVFISFVAALGLVAGASMLQSTIPAYVFMGIMGMLGTSVMYGSTKLAQKTDSDIYVARIRSY